MAMDEQEMTSDMGLFNAEPPPFSEIFDSSSGEREHRLLRGATRELENDRRAKIRGRGHWRPAEDAKLKELVSRLGPRNWNLIAQKLQGRSGKSCRLRWFNQLDPRINRKAFSDDEQERILAAHRLYGNKWAHIARLFPGRTDKAVKNHWHVVMARKQREQSNARGRRKPLACSSISKMPEVSPSSNASSGESATTATREEPASTCTDLFLSSFPRSTATIANQKQSYCAFKGSDGKPDAETSGLNEKTLSDSCGNFFSHSAPPALTPGLHHSGLSEASTSEPVAHQVTHALLYGLKKQGRQSIMLPFIDFLCVGAT